MLIQRAKLFIPLIHLKNGIMGLKGHTCAFPQNVHEVADKLPRLPNDVTIIRVILNTQAEIGRAKKNSINHSLFVNKLFLTHYIS